MLRNYLKIALRNLQKGRLFSALNLMGLSLGLMVSMLLLLYVNDEWAFDQHIRKAKDLYRVNVTATFDGESMIWATAPNVVGPALKEGIPEVKAFVRYYKHNFGESASMRIGAKKLVENSLFWADQSLISLFELKMLQGNAAKALDAPDKVILSQSAAERYFGSADPLGEIIKVDNASDLQVTGVFADLPGNSSFDANVIGSLSSQKWAYDNLVWSNASFETFVQLAPGADPAKVDRKIAQIVDKNVEKENQWFSLGLQPMLDIHMHSADITNQTTTRLGDPQQARILGWLAMIILVLACINYMNLTTARSQQRFREVGISKTLGAGRGQLALRFYAETGILVFGALILGMVLLALAIPAFNQLADKNLKLSAVLQPQTLGLIFGIGMVVMLVAGSYPALLLSGFNPKNLLATSFRSSTGAGLLRRGLVVLQFTAAVALIASTYVFNQQLKFIQNYQLGFEPEQVVALSISSAENAAQRDALANKCLEISEVVDVSKAQTFPGRGASGRNVARPDSDGDGMAVQTNRADHKIISTLGIKLLAGTSIPELPKSPTDSTCQIVVNKAIIDYLGYTPEEAVGKKVDNMFWYPTTIVGVMEDFHSEDLHTQVGGYAFHNMLSEGYSYLLVKLKSQNLAASMAKLERAYANSMPNSAFEYTFLDEHMAKLYERDQRTSLVVLVFSILSIFIACLGLFGLAAYTAEQRTKEIGVRKVLGASVGSIIALLSKDFLRLVLVAVILAAPLAWYMMSRWLETFAYRIDLNWTVFLISGLIALVVAFLTVSSQSLRAAQCNPVESLKSE
jgi:putative ABC transport system permease protein